MVSSGGLALILNVDYIQNGRELRIRRFESYLRSQFPFKDGPRWLCADLPTAHVYPSTSWKDLKKQIRIATHVPSWHYEYIFTMPELVAAWEHLLEFGKGFLGETLLEFRGRDVVEVF